MAARRPTLQESCQALADLLLDHENMVANNHFVPLLYYDMKQAGDSRWRSELTEACPSVDSDFVEQHLGSQQKPATCGRLFNYVIKQARTRPLKPD